MITSSPHNCPTHVSSSAMQSWSLYHHITVPRMFHHLQCNHHHISFPRHVPSSTMANAVMATLSQHNCPRQVSSSAKQSWPHRNHKTVPGMFVCDSIMAVNMRFLQSKYVWFGCDSIMAVNRSSLQLIKVSWTHYHINIWPDRYN